MNLNENLFGGGARRKQNSNRKGKRQNVMTIQRGTEVPRKKSTPKRKNMFDATVSSSDFIWQNTTNMNSLDNTTTSSRSYTTSELDSKIIIAISEGRGEASCEVGIASINVSRPELILCQISDSQSYINVLTKINVLNPVEILIPITMAYSRLTNKIKEKFDSVKITGVSRQSFNKNNGMMYVRQLCAPAWNSIFLVLQHKYYALTAASALITYLETNMCVFLAKESIKIDYQQSEGFTIIDVFTADKLELVACAIPGPNAKYSSLRGILNHCVTKIGARTLRASILQPSCSIPDIEARLDCVEELVKQPEKILYIQGLLKQISNIEQLLNVTTIIPEQAQSCSGRQLNYILLLNSLFDLIQPLKTTFQNSKQPFFIELRESLNCKELASLMEIVRGIIQPDARPSSGEQGIIERCFAVKSGVSEVLDIIRKNYSEKLDSMREYVKDLGKNLNMDLKLSNNTKKGYHIVHNLGANQRKSFKKSDLPPEFIQVERLTTMVTMKTAEILTYSARLEDIITEILKLCNILIHNVLLEIRKRVSLFYKLCDDIAKLDVIQSLAKASINNPKYVRPKFGEITEVLNGRHPLLDYICDVEPISNNILAAPQYNVNIITGPNGSGKSIFIRQVVLLQVMAQVGCYVPATSAIFRVADRILARIYLEDNMDYGASAFVLEMKEIQYFHSVLTKNSLVIIDELCRSTSIHEGTALAMAICENFLDKSAFVFFTTHYTMIAKLRDMYFNVKCWQLEAKEIQIDDRITLKFTYKVFPGVTSMKEYAIYLAKASWHEIVMKDVENILKYMDQVEEENPSHVIHPALRLKYDLESELQILKSKKCLTTAALREKLYKYQIELQALEIHIDWGDENTSFRSNRNEETAGDDVIYPEAVYSESSSVEENHHSINQSNENLENEDVDLPIEGDKEDQLAFSQECCTENENLNEFNLENPNRLFVEDENIAQILYQNNNYNFEEEVEKNCEEINRSADIVDSVRENISISNLPKMFTPSIIYHDKSSYEQCDKLECPNFQLYDKDNVSQNFASQPQLSFQQNLVDLNQFSNYYRNFAPTTFDIEESNFQNIPESNNLHSTSKMYNNFSPKTDKRNNLQETNQYNSKMNANSNQNVSNIVSPILGEQSFKQSIFGNIVDSPVIGTSAFTETKRRALLKKSNQKLLTETIISPIVGNNEKYYSPNLLEQLKRKMHMDSSLVKAPSNISINEVQFSIPLQNSTHKTSTPIVQANILKKTIHNSTLQKTPKPESVFKKPLPIKVNETDPDVTAALEDLQNYSNEFEEEWDESDNTLTNVSLVGIGEEEVIQVNVLGKNKPEQGSVQLVDDTKEKHKLEPNSEQIQNIDKAEETVVHIKNNLNIETEVEANKYEEERIVDGSNKYVDTEETSSDESISYSPNYSYLKDYRKRSSSSVHSSINMISCNPHTSKESGYEPNKNESTINNSNCSEHLGSYSSETNIKSVLLKNNISKANESLPSDYSFHTANSKISIQNHSLYDSKEASSKSNSKSDCFSKFRETNTSETSTEETETIEMETESEKTPSINKKGYSTGSSQTTSYETITKSTSNNETAEDITFISNQLKSLQVSEVGSTFSKSTGINVFQRDFKNNLGSANKMNVSGNTDFPSSLKDAKYQFSHKSNIFENTNPEISFDLSEPSSSASKKKKKFQPPLKSTIKKPLNKLTNKEISNCYYERTLQAINSNGITSIEYSNEILNRPTIKQIKGSMPIATAVKTKDGSIVVSNQMNKQRQYKKKFKPPLKNSVGKRFNISIFSDKHSTVYEEFLDTRKDSDFDFKKFESVFEKNLESGRDKDKESFSFIISQGS